MKPPILSTPISETESFQPRLRATPDLPASTQRSLHTHAHAQFRDDARVNPPPAVGADSSSCSTESKRVQEPVAMPPQPETDSNRESVAPRSASPFVVCHGSLPAFGGSFENSRPPGRPSLFTDALVDKICDYIQNTGVSDSAAGLLAGVSTTTLSRWKAENPDFALLLEAARAELQRELITAVREARRRDGSSDWRGAAWLLEHLFPEDFGRRPRSKAQSPCRSDSVGREPGCAADSVEGRGAASEEKGDNEAGNGRAEHIETKYVSESQRSTSAEDQAERPRFQLNRSGPDPEPAEPAPAVDTRRILSAVPAIGATGPAAEAAAAIESEPRFPKPTPPEKAERPFPKPASPKQSAPVSRAPAAANDANLPETEYLPTPRRFRCARITPGVAADARARGHEPAESPQLFPKSPFPPFPSLDAEPLTSPFFPKPNPNRPSPLAGSIVPPAMTTAKSTVF